MKRKTVFLISLIAVLLLAGLCACKQEVTPEEPQNNDSIPRWEKSDDGLQSLPDIDTSGTATGVTEALLNGLKNPPELKDVKNLIVMVCEGLTTELIDDSFILNSMPVKGTTSSVFASGDKTLADYIINDQLKFMTGIACWGDLATNSMRRMTTTDGNDVAGGTVNYNQFMLNPPLKYVMGMGDFTDAYNDDALNLLYKSSAVTATTLEEVIPLYNKEDYHFYFSEAYQHDGPVNKLYTIFESEQTMPSFRQETAFSLAWMQSKMDETNGFSLLLSYSPSSALDAAGARDFDEGVAIAVKYVLENPDTALLICGCPADGSAQTVCFYGLGKGVSAQSTFYESVSALF